MRELSLAAAIFRKSEHRASQALSTLQELNNGWISVLSDAIAVYRDMGGRMCLDAAYETAPAEGATGYGLLGDLLEATLATPGTGKPRAAAITAAGRSGNHPDGEGALDSSSRKHALGVASDFVRSVGTMVEPGDSAIFALVRTIDQQFVVRQFRDSGAIVLSKILRLDQQTRVDAALHSRHMEVVRD